MTSEAATQQDVHEHGEHPSDARYVRIALILAVVTAVEVVLSYWELPAINNYTLLLLSAGKFAMVAMYFMHLKFDSRILSRLFVAGLVLAIGVYIAVLLMFGVFIG
jgi:cytochrome c oxidase subunit 4